MSGTDGARRPGEHVGAEVLADHAEDLLEPAQDERVRAHLAGCAACRADLDALSGVAAVLRAHADPGPVPDLVARRIDRALSAAGAEPDNGRSDDPVVPAPRPAARNSVGQARQKARTRWGRVAAGWVTAAACLAGVVVGVNALGGLQGGSSGSATSAGGGAEASVPETTAEDRASSASGGGSAGEPAAPDAAPGPEPSPTARQRTDADGFTTYGRAGEQALSDPAARATVRSLALSARAAAASGAPGPLTGGPACSLPHLDAVPGRVMRVEPLELPSGPAYAVAVTRPDGGGTAAVIARCAPDAPLLARTDAP